MMNHDFTKNRLKYTNGRRKLHGWIGDFLNIIILFSDQRNINPSSGNPKNEFIYSILIVTQSIESRRISFSIRAILPMIRGFVKGVPGNLVVSGQNTPNFVFILIRLYRSSWRQPFFPKPRGSGITTRSLKYGNS